MVNRLFRIGLAALFAAALAPAAPAWAQDDDDEEVDEDTDPCAGISPPCSDSDEDEGDSKDDDGEELASGEGEGEGEGEGSGKGDDDGDDDDGDAVASADADATIEGMPSPTVGEGKLYVTAAVQTSLVSGSEADPLSIAPDIWYGINNKLSAGLVTSIQGQSGFWSGAAGTGLCPVGDLCGNIFDNIGAEALYALKSDASFVFAIDVGLHMLSIDATFLDAKLGAKGLWRSGQISIGFAPSVLIPITERDAQNEFLNLPIDLSYMLSQSLYLGVQSGIRTPFEGIGDAYSIPVALGGLLMINPKLSAALAFSLDKVAGGGDGAGVDARSLSLVFGYTM